MSANAWYCDVCWYTGSWPELKEAHMQERHPAYKANHDDEEDLPDEEVATKNMQNFIDVLELLQPRWAPSEISAKVLEIFESLRER